MTLPDLTASAAFRPWTDPESGITSYLLHDRVAPLQQSFYFTNRQATDHISSGKLAFVNTSCTSSNSSNAPTRSINFSAF